ncbi:MAG TPA: phage holin family protein [Steroidobacteraceae bacterium]|nr:phage holin family protein [Steroidobacteraceae bacterium]
MLMGDHEISDHRKSIPGLLHQLIAQLGVLTRQELALARTELLQRSSPLRACALDLCCGAGLLFVAILVLVAAAVLALALLIPAWLAALAVGLVIGAAGLWLVERGRRHLRKTSLRPEHLADSLRRDREVLLRRIHP